MCSLPHPVGLKSVSEIPAEHSSVSISVSALQCLCVCAHVGTDHVFTEQQLSVYLRLFTGVSRELPELIQQASGAHVYDYIFDMLPLRLLYLRTYRQRRKDLSDCVMSVRRIDDDKDASHVTQQGVKRGYLVLTVNSVNQSNFSTYLCTCRFKLFF